MTSQNIINLIKEMPPVQEILTTLKKRNRLVHRNKPKSTAATFFGFVLSHQKRLKRLSILERLGFAHGTEACLFGRREPPVCFLKELKSLWYLLRPRSSDEHPSTN